MRLFLTVLLVVLIASLIGWVGPSVPVVQALPLLGGRPPGIYDLGAFALLLIAWWGVKRIRRQGSD